MKDMLLEGEKELFDCERVELAIYKSLPTIHAAASVPGLHTIKLMVTDKRAIVRGVVLGDRQVTEFDFWYPEHRPSPTSDVLEVASSGISQAGGEYLTLAARTHVHGPWRSDVVELYLYIDNARRVAQMLNELLHTDPGKRFPEAMLESGLYAGSHSTR
jgi:hypothetical protein